VTVNLFISSWVHLVTVDSSQLSALCDQVSALQTRSLKPEA